MAKAKKTVGQIDRKALVDVMEFVDPAVAKVPILPVLLNVCFDHGYVTAYNEYIGLIAPADWPLDCAVQGEVLLRWLAREGRPEKISVKEVDGKVVVDAGNAQLKLDVMDVRDYVWAFPPDKKLSAVATIEDRNLFAAAVDNVLECAGNKVGSDWSGVYLMFDKDVAMYSCNEKTAARQRVPLKGNVKFKGFMPGNSAKVVADFIKSRGAADKPVKLLEHEGALVFDLGNDYLAYIKMAEPTELETIQTLLSDFSDELAFVDLPDGFASALADAAELVGVASRAAGSSCHTTIIWEGDKIVMTTKATGYPTMTQDLKAPSASEKPLKMVVDPKFLQQAGGSIIAIEGAQIAFGRPFDGKSGERRDGVVGFRCKPSRFAVAVEMS